ncbi:peptidoglycan-binding protein [Sanguibacter suarezii]|uniref:peptidoglycan-binding protein n=1 Tax=Sanguibacter suarezii TaxID=60921 RepID=UPI0008315225|nr:peptidoglycan-binding protein [Sanguibacter suarezii]
MANSQADPAVTALVGTQEFAVPVATVTGTASAGVTTTVVPVAAAAGRTIVTGVIAGPGSVLRPGQVLAEVSGRPLIALNLPFDLYRDLAPGDSGPDVRALQQALIDTGVLTGPVDGQFGARTSAAIRALYAQNSVTAPQASPEKTGALDEAVEALAEARKPAPSDATTAPGGGADPIAPDDGDAAAVKATAKAAADAAAAAKLIKDAEIAELQRVVDEARLAADTPLPMAEVITVPADGVDVLSVEPVGTSLGGEATSVATLRQGSLSVTARVGVKDAATFPVGAAVTVTLSTGGTGIEGTITAVGDFQGASDTASLPGSDVTISFAPEATGLEDGATVLVRPSGASQTLSGLAVPLVAVRTEGAQTHVLVVEGQTTRKVEVVVDMSADGFALVASDELHDGETVLIAGTP